jgi:hypothetical protein
MSRSLRLPIAIALIGALLSFTSRPAKAQIGNIGNIGISKGQAVGIFVAAGAIAVGIGVIIYFVVRTPPTITGCAVAAPAGLALQTEGGHQTFALLGETAAIKPGDRVKIKGKRQKKDAAGNRSFLVTTLKKDYGVCSALPMAAAAPPTR